MNIKAYKQKKERGASVEEIAHELVKVSNDLDSVIIVTLTAEKEIEVSYSSDSEAELIGLLEVAKDIVVEQIRC
ncbi:hypothetical protein QT711_11290 [Sporosarcina saromensis]|uniref:Uncharacterized protein n=1 Tax=Sporosarcina saromensis TaxID=359365 RepID=A0ABU4G9X3_9BACL|nr:hypothetical protein [Sporosarcina saromensis]MDW0113772.1 hypothetical protein [Sporosarcina saromensis]